MVWSLAAGLHEIAMNFSAEKATRKWPYGAVGRARAAMASAAAAWLVLCRADRPGRGGAQDRSSGPGAACWSNGDRGRAIPCHGPRCRCRGRARPKRQHAGREAGRRSTAGSGQRSKACRNARTAAGAIGLPAGAHRCDRHRPQHSRYPWPRRLRRRGSGAARGRGAAGQAAGCAETRSDPPLRHGVGDRGLDSQRHRAADGVASAASSAISTISTRSNAVAATASPAPNCPSMAAPTRSMCGP